MTTRNEAELKLTIVLQSQWQNLKSLQTMAELRSAACAILEDLNKNGYEVQRAE